MYIDKDHPEIKKLSATNNVSAKVSVTGRGVYFNVEAATMFGIGMEHRIQFSEIGERKLSWYFHIMKGSQGFSIAWQGRKGVRSGIRISSLPLLKYFLKNTRFKQEDLPVSFYVQKLDNDEEFTGEILIANTVEELLENSKK